MWQYRHTIVINGIAKVPFHHIKIGVITVVKEWEKPGQEFLQNSAAFQFHTIHTNIAQNVITPFENVLSTYRIDGAGYSSNFELAAIPKEYGLQPDVYVICAYGDNAQQKITRQNTRVDDYPEGANEVDFPLYDDTYRVYSLQYLAWIE